MREQYLHSPDYIDGYDEESVEDVRDGQWRTDAEYEWCPAYVRGPIDLSDCYRRHNDDDDDSRYDLDKEWLDSRLEKNEDEWCDS